MIEWFHEARGQYHGIVLNPPRRTDTHLGRPP